MPAVEEYNLIVSSLFDELHAIHLRQSRPDGDGGETVIVRDSSNGSYLMVRFGWVDGRRLQAISLCVRVANGRVLIEVDWTDWGIVDRLIELGVPAEHIVFRFHRGNLTAADCK